MLVPNVPTAHTRYATTRNVTTAKKGLFAMVAQTSEPKKATGHHGVTLQSSTGALSLMHAWEGAVPRRRALTMELAWIASYGAQSLVQDEGDRICKQGLPTAARICCAE